MLRSILFLCIISSGIVQGLKSKVEKEKDENGWAPLETGEWKKIKVEDPAPVFSEGPDQHTEQLRQTKDEATTELGVKDIDSDQVQGTSEVLLDGKMQTPTYTKTMANVFCDNGRQQDLGDQVSFNACGTVAIRAGKHFFAWGNTATSLHGCWSQDPDDHPTYNTCQPNEPYDIYMVNQAPTPPPTKVGTGQKSWWYYMMEIWEWFINMFSSF